MCVDRFLRKRKEIIDLMKRLIINVRRKRLMMNIWISIHEILDILFVGFIRIKQMIYEVLYPFNISLIFRNKIINFFQSLFNKLTKRSRAFSTASFHTDCKSIKFDCNRIITIAVTRI
jgi:hypothetical protein